MSKKILIITSSHPEGVWAEELAAPYYTFKEHGCEVQIVSLKGGEIPVAEASLNPPFLTKEVEKLILDDEAMKAVTESIALSAVNPTDYDAIFMPGGHGPCYDFPDSEQLISAISTMYQSGKIVGSVCHGPVCLVNVKDRDGKPLVQGKKVSSFTDAEEREVGKHEEVPFLLESRLRELGALFENSGSWQAHAVRDGNLVTGQNPASSAPAAKLVLEALGVSA